jgi:site-specific recombinase XerD
MSNAVAYLDDSVSSWDRTLYAFLAEKERRSGSLRTVQSYSRMLNDFFGRLGKTPDQVSSQDVFAWAYGTRLSGKAPGSVTIGARLACISSFCRFLIRMKVLSFNPCDALERPKVTPSSPRGLSGDQIHVIPSTPVGLRDRAIILTLTFTGRRRTEVLSMTAGSILAEDRVYYRYRGKGGKTGKRELPLPAYEAIKTWLTSVSRDLNDMAPEESLWPDLRQGRGITSGTFYGNLRRYLKKAGLPSGGVHIFRHSAAKLRRDAGESVEEVSRFLDHSSLAVTTTYLRRLEGQEDRSWEKVAAAIGL